MFFIADFFEHEKVQLHISLIAGISVAYFFILVLPEIAENLPEYPLHLKIFEYIFILIGFIFVHVSEKLILQRVEAKSQRRMRKLLSMEESLETVEKNIENLIKKELTQETLDIKTLKHLAQTLTQLNEQEESIKVMIENYKLKIQNHVNKDLSEFKFFTNYIYHFLVGIILFFLLFVDLLGAILFFMFALFRAIVSKRAQRHVIFTDLEIYEDSNFEENLRKKLILSSSSLTGVFIGLILELVISIEVELEILYILFSFISGVILYTIVREVIPEKEKGNPLYFLIGAIGFTLIIFLIKIFTNIEFLVE